MPDNSIEIISEILITLGQKLAAWRHEGPSTGKWVGDQIKTDADQYAHKFLVERLSEEFPSIPIVSEEDPATHWAKRPDRYWLIDPIDGTASYMNCFDGFVSQIALMAENQPVLALIYAPQFSELFIAEKGSGAKLNGLPLKVKPAKCRRILIDNYPQPRGLAKKMYNELGFTDYIESGSIALKICRIADGTADVFFKDVTVRDWDIAAPHLILSETGGEITTSINKTYSFTGNYNKSGILATCDAELAKETKTWLKNNLETNEITD